MSEVESWLQNYIPGGSVLALDVGANVGNWTSFLADRFDEVHAFEPNPQAHRQLRLEIAARENVMLIEAAVSSSSGQLADFHLYERSVHATGFADLDTSDRGEVIASITIPAVSLDDLGYAGRDVEFVKIDTEGAEALILDGARDLLAAQRPALIVEVHSLANLGACQQILAESGYEGVKHLPHPHGGHPGHCWLIAHGESS